MRVAITSLGMISPVGLGVVASAAAVRASITMASEIEHFDALDEDADAAPTVGHPIRDYTEGFHLFGRWIRIAAGCLEDLLAYGTLPDRRDTGFWRATGLGLVTAVPDVHRFALDEPWSIQEITDRYGRRLLGVTEIPIPSENIDVVSLGHAGVATAVQRATQAILERKHDRVIILGADSYLDPLTLEWLSAGGRIKVSSAIDGNPVGLSPGEAGGCFLLESEQVALHRGATIQAFLLGVGASEERNIFFSEEVSYGEGLAGAVVQALAPETRFAGDLITDLNGEDWRARELAGASLRLGPRLSPARAIHPASSLGEIGAASGSVAVCLAVRSFVRGYCTNGQALVVSSSEYGHVAAVRLGKAGRAASGDLL